MAQNDTRSQLVVEISQMRQGEHPLPTREEQGLQAEVETLKQAVLTLQSERPEPPPEYRSAVN